jgi:hypothetical protein
VIIFFSLSFYAKKEAKWAKCLFFMIRMLVSCSKVIVLSLHFPAKYVANLAKKCAKLLNWIFF